MPHSNIVSSLAKDQVREVVASVLSETNLGISHADQSAAIRKQPLRTTSA
jgi:hypothetical protein